MYVLKFDVPIKPLAVFTASPTYHNQFNFSLAMYYIMSPRALHLICLSAIFATTSASPITNATATTTANLAKRTDHFGTATYFEVGLGACGYTDQNGEHIVAMGNNHFNGYCNRWIHVTNTDNGKTVTAKIRDECVSCADSNRIDLSPSAFSTIGPESQGVLNVVWHYEKA